MRGIRALFVRRDEVEEAWKWVDSITEARAADRDAPKPYQAGTRGPVASVAMISRRSFMERVRVRLEANPSGLFYR